MPKAQEVIRYPSLRSLKTIAGARHELARLYFETKKGLIDPQLAGRLSHMLSVMIGATRDHEVEQQIAELEARLPPRRPNGHMAAPLIR
jgi:hypothetical protein